MLAKKKYPCILIMRCLISSQVVWGGGEVTHRDKANVVAALVSNWGVQILTGTVFLPVLLHDAPSCLQGLTGAPWRSSCVADGVAAFGGAVRWALEPWGLRVGAGDPC